MKSKADAERAARMLALNMLTLGIPYRDAMAIFEGAFVLQAVRMSRGNHCKTAAQVGVHRNTIKRLLVKSEKRGGVKKKEVS